MTITDPLAELGATRRAYVLPQQRVMFISVAKNACTSIKWLLADLAGEDLSRFALEPMSFRIHAEHAIHERAKFRHVPNLAALPAGMRETIHPDNGWFVFALTRDPRTRLFSAWQQKFLLREPAYRQYQREEWFPRLPVSAAGITADFARFVDVLTNDPNHPLRVRDSHFMGQTELLRRDVVPYSRVYDVHQMSELTRDLSKHLSAFGATAELPTYRSNDTPLKANAGAFPDDLRAKVERIYAEDFSTIDAPWDFDVIAANPEWSTEALRGAFARAETAQRFGDVRAVAVRKIQRVDQLQQKVDRLQQKVGRLQGRLAANPLEHPTVRKVRRRVARWRRGRR